MHCCISRHYLFVARSPVLLLIHSIFPPEIRIEKRFQALPIKISIWLSIVHVTLTQQGFYNNEVVGAGHNIDKSHF